MVCLCVVVGVTGRCAVFGGAGQSGGGVFACGIDDGADGVGGSDGMLVCSVSDKWSLCCFWWCWSVLVCLRVVLVIV